MAAAAVVIVLVVMVFPITLLLAALVFDAAVIAWVVSDRWYHEYWPGLRAWNHRVLTVAWSHRPHWHLPHRA